MKVLTYPKQRILFCIHQRCTYSGINCGNLAKQCPADRTRKLMHVLEIQRTPAVIEQSASGSHLFF